MEKIKQNTIYLDNAATTFNLEKLVKSGFGNASSRTHEKGLAAKKLVDDCRSEIAQLINSKPAEIVFTSGATEGINTLIKGLFETYGTDKKEIITSKTEHKAVLDTCAYLETKGAIVHYLNVDKNGLVSIEELNSKLSPSTLLVSVMLVNNETGVIQPIKELAEITHKNESYFMCDATQGFGKLEIDPSELGIDLMTFSGHKIHGPKGIGGMYIKQQYPKINVAPLIHGGGHERGYRSGTLNVGGIVGLSVACNHYAEHREKDYEFITQLRDKFETAMLSIDGCEINGIETERSPYISSVYLQGVNSEALIINVKKEIAIANGSACTSTEILPSHVIMAMFNDENRAKSTIRVSYSKFNTIEEIDTAAKCIISAVKRIRESVLI